MKKLLCLAMCFLMLFSFVACGGSGDSTDTGANNGGSTGVAATSIKFNKTDYSVGIGEDIDLSSEITVEPNGADVVFTVSGDSAVVSGKGVVSGEGVGKVTVTAASKDGSVKATCKVDVYGFGGIYCTGDSIESRISCKRPSTPEFTLDKGSLIILVSKNATADTDYSELVNLKSGSFAENYDQYHIVQTGTSNSKYELKNIPTGDYYGIIVSYYDYNEQAHAVSARLQYYKTRNVAEQLKAKGVGNVLSEAAINKLTEIVKDREYCVKEITIEHEVDKSFSALFYADTGNITAPYYPYLAFSIDEFNAQMK